MYLKFAADFPAPEDLPRYISYISNFIIGSENVNIIRSKHADMKSHTPKSPKQIASSTKKNRNE